MILIDLQLGWLAQQASAVLKQLHRPLHFIGQLFF